MSDPLPTVTPVPITCLLESPGSEGRLIRKPLPGVGGYVLLRIRKRKVNKTEVRDVKKVGKRYFFLNSRQNQKLRQRKPHHLIDRTYAQTFFPIYTGDLRIIWNT